MTPLGVRSLSRPAVTAERQARVATLGRVFHQGRSSFWTLRGCWKVRGASPRASQVEVSGPMTPHKTLAFNRSMQRFARVYRPASDSRVSCVAAY